MSEQPEMSVKPTREPRVEDASCPVIAQLGSLRLHAATAYQAQSRRNAAAWLDNADKAAILGELPDQPRSAIPCFK